MIPNTPSAKEKTKALDLALQQIEKQFGKGAIMKLGEESAQVAVEIIPSGSIALDMALGIGGIPRGRVVEIYGPESSGKTTLALTIIANAQKTGGNAVFIDAEHALDAAYAQKLAENPKTAYPAEITYCFTIRDPYQRLITKTVTNTVNDPQEALSAAEAIRRSIDGRTKLTDLMVIDLEQRRERLTAIGHSLPDFVRSSRSMLGEVIANLS